MNDVLRIAELPPDEPPIEKRPKKVLQFLPEEKPNPQAKSAEVLRLEATIRTLRDELLRLQRQLGHYESLQRNSQVREQELRAQLLPRQRKEFS
jgi:hypothetical protein